MVNSVWNKKSFLPAMQQKANPLRMTNLKDTRAYETLKVLMSLLQIAYCMRSLKIFHLISEKKRKKNNLFCWHFYKHSWLLIERVCELKLSMKSEATRAGISIETVVGNPVVNLESSIITAIHFSFHLKCVFVVLVAKLKVEKGIKF